MRLQNLDHALHRFAAAGATATEDLAFDPHSYEPVAEYFRTHDNPVRLRTYEISGARDHIPRPLDADPTLRPVGVKIWSDGSPWIGNIETSFGYQDSPHTRAIGVHPGHRGCSNYTPEQLLELCRKYVSQGWQIACHVPGDIAVDTVLDTFDGVQQETGRTDLRLRMEHCGSITADQVRRAHELGVTISFFVAHLYYYGEVLRDFIGTHAENWTPAGAVLGPDVAIGVREAIRAQTIYPTWQLHSDHEIGSIEPGKFADFVVLDANPLTVPAHDIHTIHIRGTWINGRRASAKTNDRAESTT